MAATASFAQTTDNKPGVQIQGNFNGGYQMNSYHGVNVKGIDQNGAGTTAINIRGLEDLGGGMSAYFRVENDLSIMNNATNQGVLPAYGAAIPVASGTVNPNPVYQKTTGAASSWANGELAVGARSGFGDIAFGALNNAGLNYIQLTAAPTQGTSFGGGYGTVLGADPTMSTVRWANSFRYLTPTYNGFQASYIYAAKQSAGTKTAASANGIASTVTSLGVGLNSQVGASELGLKWTNGPATVAAVTSRTSLSNFCSAATLSGLTNTTVVSGTNQSANNPCYSNAALSSPIDASQDNKQSSLAGSYDLGNGFLVSGAVQKTTLGAIGSLTTGSNAAYSDRSAQFLNAQYSQGVHTVFVAIGNVKENAAANTKVGLNSKFTGMGYNYALSKMTSLVARYEVLDDKANVLGTILPAATSPYAQTQGTDANNTKRVRSMVGINMNF